ncbi:MAG: hypothetical protein H0T15_03595, partial [Thermoleophilaceae bacterium]|nr:hypothetical protein [Thermoleophilaceae bacterium]
SKLGASPGKPTTLIGVNTLFDPDFLIEIDATAVQPLGTRSPGARHFL